VKDSYSVIVDGIVHHFDKVGVAVKADQQVLVFEAFPIQFGIVLFVSKAFRMSASVTPCLNAD
jgi:hypothetical protein